MQNTVRKPMKNSVWNFTKIRHDIWDGYPPRKATKEYSHLIEAQSIRHVSGCLFRLKKEGGKPTKETQATTAIEEQAENLMVSSFQSSKLSGHASKSIFFSLSRWRCFDRSNSVGCYDAFIVESFNMHPDTS